MSGFRPCIRRGRTNQSTEGDQMWARLLTLMALGALAVGAACSSATAPGPTFLGSWRVLESGGGPYVFTPDTFTVTFAGGRGDTLTVAMPPVAMYYGHFYVFDSVMTKSSPRADTLLFAARDTFDTVWIEF